MTKKKGGGERGRRERGDFFFQRGAETKINA